MTYCVIRPDLKTSGGEVSDILWKDRFVGTITLVYREADRISGAIQLEDASLHARDKEQVVEVLQDYVQSLVDALGALECDVVVTHSPYDRIIADKNEYGAISVGDNEYYDTEDDRDFDTEWIDDSGLADPDYAGQDEVSMAVHRRTVNLPKRKAGPAADEAVYYELVAVGENHNSVEYHVYDRDQNWLAEAFFTIDDRDVMGTVRWMVEPDEDGIEHVADLIVSDFDENEVDTFVINMMYEDDIVETIELAHEDLLDEVDAAWEAGDNAAGERWKAAEDEYTVVLARDDGDMLTYEIYQQSRGGLPIGTATIDISQRQLTGFIDFREPGSEDDREQIATLLMRELDKEKEYETINLTLLHRNEPIEEILFESEHIH
ncbi:hypothetical protein [Paenibacillus hamazuiensis]|uniref:hypothetical protein n=1 Tax=Paenibacillus hamazuiensis TaxID=2936508 RepID=UPI00200E4DE4|nr:hypothetical protein [Paenibacillus hamazuiensis]